MRLTVDSKACEANGLTFNEFIVLYISAKNIDIQEAMKSLVEKKVADRDLFNENGLILGSKTKQLVERIILDSDNTVQANSERIKNLAKTLQELYIPGKKAGTQDYFKGSSAEIVQRLKRFFAEYGDFTDEQIIEATKKYVASFNGDYKFAQLLKYFISKKVDGERGSRLLTYIENMGQADVVVSQQEIDWGTELR
jgi:hypothetical protein